MTAQPLKKAKTTVAVPQVQVNNQSTVESSESSSQVSSGQSSQSKSDKSSTQVEEKPVTESADVVREKCKLRMEEFKKTIKKNMALSDQLDMRDP